MEEAATDAAASVSKIRLTSAGVITRERSRRRRLPVSTPTPYIAVLKSNQAETQIPSSRTSAVRAGSGLDCWAQVRKCARSTEPRRPLACTKKTSKALSPKTTPVASR
jgi:hypothetical protein